MIESLLSGTGLCADQDGSPIGRTTEELQVFLRRGVIKKQKRKEKEQKLQYLDDFFENLIVQFYD